EIHAGYCRGRYLNFSVTVVWCALPPPFPVIVKVYVPRFVDLEVVMFNVEAPLPPGIVPGAKLAETPAGTPLTLSTTFEAKPPDGLAVTAYVVGLPRVMVR